MVFRPEVKVAAYRTEHAVVLNTAWMRLVVAAAEIEIPGCVDDATVVPEDAAKSEEVAADVCRRVCLVGNRTVIPRALRGAVECCAALDRDSPAQLVILFGGTNRARTFADEDWS